MYVISVVLLLFVLPVISIVVERLFGAHGLSLLVLTGRWFCFWAVGVRLFLAGLRQTTKPGFTAEAIFRVSDPGAWPIVREVGFANVSMGLLGLLSLWRSEWLIPASIVGGLYYGLAGAGHLAGKERNAKRTFAMVSDFVPFVVLGVFVVKSLV
jgi:hypothetical protein